MPPKRRHDPDVSSKESPPKRRSTRLQTIKDAAPINDEPKHKKQKIKGTKTQITPKKDSAPKKAPKVPASAAKAESNNTDTNNTTPDDLTITHPLVKKPIQCHKYSPSSLPRSPSPPPYSPSSLSYSSSPPHEHIPRTLIFTHGAGGTLSAPGVINFCTGYTSYNPVLAFRGSMNLGARVKGFHACIEHLETSGTVPAGNSFGNGKKMVLGGRSMGARAAVIAANEIIPPSTPPIPSPLPSPPPEVTEINLILVSYPLKSGSQTRDEILLELHSSISVLFIIGSKDAMCPIGALNEVREKMRAETSLAVVEGADHGMHVRPLEAERALGERSGWVASMWADGIRWDGVENLWWDADEEMVKNEAREERGN